MKKILSLLLCTVAIIFAFTGCGTPKEESKNNNGTKIITSFYPMYVTTINITKGVEGVEVINMTKPQTGCLHDYQLTTEDMKLLETANIFVINGASMEDFLSKVASEQPNLKIIEASSGIELLDSKEGKNPHVWVSISNAIIQTENITNKLCDFDPKHADVYKKNCAEYTKKLSALRNEMHIKLDKYAGKEIVTFHEAFPYFAKEFNLKIATVIEREPGSEQTPKEIEDTIKKMERTDFKAIFVEPQYSPKAAQTISEATGVEIQTLDPCVTGEANPEAIDSYINTMKNNLIVLEKALGK